MYRRTTLQQQSPPSELSLRTAEHMGEMKSDLKHVRATLYKHDKRITKLENPRIRWQDLLPWLYGLALLFLVAWGKLSLADAIGLMGKG